MGLFDGINSKPDVVRMPERADGQPYVPRHGQRMAQEAPVPQPYAPVPEQQAFQADPPKVLQRKLSADNIRERNADIDFTLREYGENLRDRGVSEDQIRDYLQGEKVKMNREFNDLDRGVQNPYTYHEPTNWDQTAASLRENGAAPAARQNMPGPDRGGVSMAPRSGTGRESAPSNNSVQGFDLAPASAHGQAPAQGQYQGREQVPDLAPRNAPAKDASQSQGAAPGADSGSGEGSSESRNRGQGMSM